MKKTLPVAEDSATRTAEDVPSTGSPQQEAAYCSSLTHAQWTSATSDSDPEKDKLSTLRRSLAEIIRTENLLILAGAGTSLSAWRSCNNVTTNPEPTRNGLWKAAKGLWKGDFAELMTKVNFKVEESGDNIEALLSQCHLAQAFSPDPEVKSFAASLERLIVDTCRFVNGTTDLAIHEVMLRKAARRSRRLPRIKVFTTNYDRCFEEAAGLLNFVVVDGFSHTFPQEFDSEYFSYDLVRRSENDESPDYIPNVFHLYKLHGSVDWCKEDGRVRRKEEPENPLLIYPRSSKFEASYEPPFLDMMGRFQSAIRLRSTALIIIGFGFADSHLTQPIVSAIRSNVGLRVVVVDPALTSAPTPDAVARMKALIEAGDSRICLVSATFEQFVRLLPEPDATTEQEMHLERLRKLQT